MAPNTSKPSVDVVVAGHRDLYGTPRAIHRAGLLRYLVTDFYVGRGSVMNAVPPLLRFGLTRLRKLLARDSGLPARHIVANNLLGVRAFRAHGKAKGASGAATVHRRHAEELARTYTRRCRPAADVVV